MLPLIGLTIRSGRFLVICAALLRLLVPITEPESIFSRDVPFEEMKTSLADSLLGTHAKTRFLASFDGMSFKL